MFNALDRRGFLAVAAGAGLPSVLASHLWASEVGTQMAEAAPDNAVIPYFRALTIEQLAAAEAVLGLSYTDSERNLMLAGINRGLGAVSSWHATPLPNGVAPAVRFDPVPQGMLPVGQPAAPKRAAVPAGAKAPVRRAPAVLIKKPESESDWAFISGAAMGQMIHRGVTTSRKLVERSLARFDQFNPELLCAITLTKERALEQADRMDSEAKKGKFRGPLHGVPYGAKDLYSVPDYPTTWGSPIYKDQKLTDTAAVIEKLDNAGAVLVAKTSLGEFAQGDVWFGGTTKNPWNTTQGSSGSSAGTASSVSAGIVPFGLGTETLGSIISPSTTCGVTGLRPTFGRISRHGAMALSWTMDKVGIIGRYAEDLALAFEAIHGADPRDPSTRQMPFSFDGEARLSGIRIGVHQGLAEPAATASDQQKAAYQAQKPVFDALIKAGAVLKPVVWPTDLQVPSTNYILSVEASAAFEELTRDNRDDQMVLQNAGAWPNTFRTAHFVDAVQYVQANRARTQLMQRVADFFKDIDVMIIPANGGNILTVTNLTGHPQVCVPTYFAANNPTPRSISFIGALYREDLALRLAHAWQKASDVHMKRPPKFA